MHRPNTLLALGTVIVFGAIFAWPAWENGFPAGTYDGRIHALWASEFTQQSLAGEWYPRWLFQLNGGLGSPTFFYYPPLPYLITAGFGRLIPNYPGCWQELGLSASLALVLSGVFALAWLRQLVPLWAAAGGAVCYLLMPFHLLIDLYTRGAFAEFWAMTWLPLVLWSAHRVGIGGRHAVVVLAFAYALLITSHLPTTLLFSIVPPVYAALIACTGEKRLAFCTTASGMALGIGISAIYLLPALTLGWAVSMSALTREFQYSKYFFFDAFNLKTFDLGYPFERCVFVRRIVDAGGWGPLGGTGFATEQFWFDAGRRYSGARWPPFVRL